MLIFYHLSAYLSIVYLILAKMAEFNIEPVNTLESSKNKYFPLNTNNLHLRGQKLVSS